MREWLKSNDALRIKYGTKRSDGKVFCGYGLGYSNGEHWADESVIQNNRKICRENMRKVRADPSYKKAYSDYCRSRYANREDVREKNAKRIANWNAKNPEKCNQRAAKRRAAKRNLMHNSHDEKAEAAMHAEAKRLTLETGIEHHVDHIIPIAHGGWHHHLNLQVLPHDINQSKNSNPFWVSETYKDFRSVPQELWPDALVDFYLAIRTA